MEIFKIFGIFAIDNASANHAIDETMDKAEESQSRIGSAFEKIGSAAVAVGKTIAAGLAVGMAAIVGLAKQVIGKYADYEQLVGGVETLFGSEYETVEEYAKAMGMSIEKASESFTQYQERQSTVLKNAAIAYETAGMSANEYMETVTGFAASLNASLGENAAQSAAYADLAIRNMSDNANKMGTSMESIKNAYSGFSKQNFTMLDNLKLGYGGTKEEMERLLEDAEKLENLPIGSYDVNNYADIIKAIDTIQEHLGINGTTAKEAASTISGSLSMLKASWTNLLTGMADETQDFGALVGTVVDNVGIFAGNLIPRIRVVFDQVPVLVKSLVPEIPGLLESLLPGLVEGAVALINGLVEAMPQIIQALSACTPALIEGFIQISKAIVKAMPQIIKALKDAIPGLFRSIVQAMFKEQPQVMEFVENLWTKLKETAQYAADKFKPVFEDIREALKKVKEALDPLIDAFMDYVLEGGLAEDITDLITIAVDLLADAYWVVSGAVSGMVEGIKDTVEWGKKHKDALELVAIAIGTVTTAIISYNAAKITKKAIDVADTIQLYALEAADLAHAAATTVATTATTAFGAAMAFLTSPITAVIVAIGALIAAIVMVIKHWDDIKEAASLAWEKIKEIFSHAWDWFKEHVSYPIGEAFSNLWDGLKKGASEAWEAVKEVFGKVAEWFEGVFTKAWEAVKGVFEKGGKIFDGIKEGIADTFKTIVNGLISGINKVVAVPFNAINDTLNSIRNVGVAGVHPFKGLWDKNPIYVPEIPQLYEGTVLEKGQVGLLEGKGAEAVIPLHNNRKWISKVARDMSEEFAGTGVSGETAEMIVQKLDDLIILVQRVLGMNITLDTGVLVGELAPAMDTELGILSEYKGRGN